MNQNEFITKISEKLYKFLNKFTFMNKDFIDGYGKLYQMNINEKRMFIISLLKPFQNDLDSFLEKNIVKYGMKKSDFKPEDYDKFKRYLQALCEAIVD